VHGVQPEDRGWIEGILAELRSQRIQPVLRLAEGHAAFQTADGPDGQQIAMGSVVTDVVGDPKIGGRVSPRTRREEQLEAGRQHTDDAGTGLASAEHFPAENGGAPGIAPLPVFIAEDGGTARRNENLRPGWLRHGVGLGEIAAEGDPGTHQPEEIGGYQRLANLFRAAVFAGYKRAEGGDAAERSEDRPGAGAQVEEIGVGM